MKTNKVAWAGACTALAGVLWLTGLASYAAVAFWLNLVWLGILVWEARRKPSAAELPPGEAAAPAAPPARDTVLVAAVAERVRSAHAAAVSGTVLALAYAGTAAVTAGVWRYTFSIWAIVTVPVVVSAVVDALRFRRPLPGSWTGLDVVGPAAAKPWRLARTADGTELAFKLTSADDVLTHHVEETGRLAVLGEPRVGGPVRIGVPGRPIVGLAMFSKP